MTEQAIDAPNVKTGFTGMIPTGLALLAKKLLQIVPYAQLKTEKHFVTNADLVQTI